MIFSTCVQQVAVLVRITRVGQHRKYVNLKRAVIYNFSVDFGHSIFQNTNTNTNLECQKTLCWILNVVLVIETFHYVWILPSQKRYFFYISYIILAVRVEHWGPSAEGSLGREILVKKYQRPTRANGQLLWDEHRWNEKKNVFSWDNLVCT